MLQKLRGKNQKGFTLIELMIVIAIIGILSAIAIPNFLEYRTKGQNTAAKGVLQNFYALAMAYFADVGPATFDASGSVDAIKFAGADSNITLAGTITMNGAGEITSGNITSSHDSSSTTYTLDTNTGAITY